MRFRQKVQELPRGPAGRVALNSRNLKTPFATRAATKHRSLDHSNFLTIRGAVAAILTIYMIEDGVEVVRVVTFGQPRFTTADGAKRLSFLPLARVVDENDIVPMVPPASAINLRFGPYEHVGPEVILLEGRNIVYLPSHDANRISLGEFWRSVSFADLKDHDAPISECFVPGRNRAKC